MSTTPAPDLPPEVLDEIFAYSTLSLSHPEASSTLAVFSLVARGWTGVAQRRMLSNVVVTGGKQIKALIRGTARVDRGGAAQSLEVHFMPGEHPENGVPNVREFEQKNMVSMDDFVTLLKQTPRLKSLTLVFPTFTRFRRRDSQDLAGVFGSLTELKVNLQEYDPDLDVLRGILELASSLERLAVDCDVFLKTNTRVRPLSTFSTRLKYLDMDDVYFSNAVIAQNFLPGQALVDLEELVYYSGELDGLATFEDMRTFFSNLSNLKRLTCYDQLPRHPDLIPRIFELCPQLEELRGYLELTAHALDSLPSNLKLLECNTSEELTGWFQSLPSRPQNTFAVEHLVLLSDVPVDLVAAIPPTVRHVSLFPFVLRELVHATPPAAGALWDRLRLLDGVEICGTTSSAYHDSFISTFENMCLTHGVTVKYTQST